MKLNSLIRQVVKTIKDYDPEKVILFGSYAEGNADECSDIDLVIIKKTTSPFMERLKEVIKYIKVPIKADILVYTPQEWDLMRKQKNILIAIVRSKGKILYEKQRA